MFRGKTPTHITVRPFVLNDALEKAIMDGLRAEFPDVDRLIVASHMALAIDANGKEHILRQDGRCTPFDRYMYWEFQYSGPTAIAGQREVGLYDLKILPGRISGLLGEPLNFGDWVILIHEIELDNYERTLKILSGKGN